eukprot:TRINITY_DN3724_c0_g3_i1.p1 TRINITY_DN3724_c0_g3~~TRINITY_DN3724_c0_g3_i1.p1  ORF type:complete len:264 (-),score=45.14 TRINITY_DN3724_c0_g3_i1:130-921(-)
MRLNPRLPDSHLASKTQYNFKEKNIPELSNTALFSWSNFSKRPLTIHSNKARSNFQGTYYGFKEVSKAAGNPMLCSFYLPKNKRRAVKHSEMEVGPTMGVKSNIKFPAELYANMGKEQFTGGSPTDYNATKFRNNTAEFSRFFKQGAVLPVLQGNVKAKPKEELRPCTGNSEWKELLADKAGETPKGRVGTAQTQKHGKGQRSVRISTPQTTSLKRPDSRYNKETLYAKLDYGRASSPEYKVPIIDMNFSEVRKQQIIPECWK